MVNLTIPETIQPGLKQLRDLSKTSAQELLDTLRTEKPSLRGDDYASSVAKKVTNIPPDAIKQIIKSLTSLYSARHYFELAKEDLASEVAKAPALIGTGTQQKKFEDRLVQFFDVEAISVTSKAFDILSSHENTLTSVRVLTDIRPIFSEDDNEPPTAAVVVHTLKISYRKNDEHREFFVAMDTSDVASFRTALKRADAKAKSVESILHKSDIPYLEVTNENPTDLAVQLSQK